MQEAPGVTVHRAITHTLLAELRSSAEQPDIARPEHARDAISMTDSLPHKHCLPHWPASWLIQLSRPVRALQGGSGACCWDMAWAQAGWSPLPSAPEAQPMSGGAWACVGTHPGVCIRCPLTHPGCPLTRPACPQTGVPSHILVSPARSPHTSWCLHQVSRLLHAQPVAMAVCRPAPQLGCGWPEGWDGLSWSGAQCLCVGSHPGRRVCAPWLLGCSGDHRERVTNTDCSAARASACFGIWALCTIFREGNSNFTYWGLAESSIALMCSETGHGSNNRVPEGFVPGTQLWQRGRITGNWSEFRVAQLLAGCKFPNPIVLLQPLCHMWSTWVSLVKIFSLYMETGCGAAEELIQMRMSQQNNWCYL